MRKQQDTDKIIRRGDDFYLIEDQTQLTEKPAKFKRVTMWKGAMTFKTGDVYRGDFRQKKKPS